jgi:hypothetical protein
MKYLAILAVILVTGCSGKTEKPESNKNETVVTPSNPETVKTAATKMINSFYSEYITQCSSSATDDAAGRNAIIEKYCTAELTSKVKNSDPDFDPFLNAQDCDIAWLKTLTITQDENNKDTYYICYTAAPGEEPNCIDLKVIEEKGRFKISSVEIVSL